MKRNLFISVVAVFAVLGCSDDDKNSGVSAAYEVSNETSVPLPDRVGNIASPIESTLAVTAQGNVSHPERFKIVLEFNHTWCGDIVAQLIAPNGDETVLIKRIGASGAATFGSSANFVSGNFITINTLEGAEIMTTGLTTESAIPTGTYLITGANDSNPLDVTMTSLETFLNGRSVNGEWKLRVVDFGPGDTGSLESWKIVLDEGAL